MFGRLALRPFVKAHKPVKAATTSAEGAIATFKDILPASVLALWRKYGLGLYGKGPIQLIDPAAWQATLDSWITQASTTGARVPFALLPFGQLAYWRQLEGGASDVALLNPFDRTTQSLGSLEAFMNTALSTAPMQERLMPAQELSAARDSAGPLTAGNLYEIDPVLLPAQILQIQQRPAQEAYANLLRQSKALAQPRPDGSEPLHALIPEEHKAELLYNLPRHSHHSGLFYSGAGGSYHTLLRLDTDRTYRLLYWQTDSKAYRQRPPRLYVGRFKAIDKNLDALIKLSIEFREDSLGSDGEFSILWSVIHNNGHLLLPDGGLGYQASAISWDGTMGEARDYMIAASGDFVPPSYEEQTRQAPEWDNLPSALKKQIHNPPLEAEITDIGSGRLEADGSEYYVTIEWADGAVPPRMNQRLTSPAGADKTHFGWCSTVTGNTARVRLKPSRDAAGKIIGKPAVGDRITTRALTAGSF